MKDQKALIPPDRLWRRPNFLIGLVIAAYLLLGLVLVTHYGESWDEHFRRDYARYSLLAYQGGSTNLPDEKGPFYGMVATLGARALQSIFASWKSIDAWHFMTYLSFVLGVYFFYRLCRRLVDSVPALAATLLFSIQPVVWGHAFINPKDTPFLAFFLASVTLGLEMVDRYCPRVTASLSPLETGIRQDWQAAPRCLRGWLAGLGAAFLGLLLLFPTLQTGIASLVHAAYTAAPSSELGNLFSRLAQHAGQIPEQAYAHKAQTISAWLAMAIWTGLIIASVLVGRRIFPQLAGTVPDSRGFGMPTQSGNKVLRWLPILLAAWFLGFCSDLRTLGPASGLLVVVYFLYKARWKALPALLVYLAIAAVVIYGFWPYLWPSPLARYLSSFSEAANFQQQFRHILFASFYIPVEEVPAGYLPTLFGLQLTETALAAILVGTLIAAFCLWKRPSLRLDILLLAVWFLAPVIAAIVNHSTLYNNFRQFLFVLPPLFVLASLALQYLWDLLAALKRRWIFALVALALLLPGLYWNVRLHPYEYIYYNSLTGGVRQAFRYYDMDYWATSLKEDFDYLNQAAPQNATVFLPSADLVPIAGTYARPDLKIESSIPNGGRNGYYAIVLVTQYEDRTHFPNSATAYAVTRDGAILSLVKQVKPGDVVGNW